MARTRTRRDWVVTTVYIAAVIIAVNLKDPLGVSWFGFAAFLVALSAAIAAYYRVTR